MNRLLASLSLVLTGLILTATTVEGQGHRNCSPSDLRHNTRLNRSSVWTGFGFLNARGSEIVLGGPGGPAGNEFSHLVWDVNNALTFNLGFEGEITGRWSMFADAVVSLDSDNSHMVDYDWIYPTSDWSHWSLHPDTNLNHYFQFDFGLDYLLHEQQNFSAAIRAGFRYTDISFDAYGGSYIYSDNGGFRNSSGVFNPNIHVISYRQKYPGLYIGPRVKWTPNQKFMVRIGAQAGYAIEPSAQDHHWLRRLVFVDHLEATPFYGFMLGVDYDLAPNATFYVEASYDKYVRTEGSTEVKWPTGSFGLPPDSAAADLRTTQIKAGVRIHGWKPRLFKEEKRPANIFRYTP